MTKTESLLLKLTFGFLLVLLRKFDMQSRSHAQNKHVSCSAAHTVVSRCFVCLAPLPLIPSICSPSPGSLHKTQPIEILLAQSRYWFRHLKPAPPPGRRDSPTLRLSASPPEPPWAWARKVWGLRRPRRPRTLNQTSELADIYIYYRYLWTL